MVAALIAITLPLAGYRLIVLSIRPLWTKEQPTGSVQQGLDSASRRSQHVGSQRVEWLWHPQQVYMPGASALLDKVNPTTVTEAPESVEILLPSQLPSNYRAMLLVGTTTYFLIFWLFHCNKYDIQWRITRNNSFFISRWVLKRECLLCWCRIKVLQCTGCATVHKTLPTSKHIFWAF